MGRRLFTLAVIVIIAVVIVGAIGYAIFVISAGTSEPTQGLDVQPLQDAEGSIYEIDQQQSTARFEIAEVLRGADIIVEGETNQVGGQLSVNFEDPEESQIGEIIINARTLETDNEDRNRAIRTFILQSNNAEYEFITFTPVELTINSQSSDNIVVGTVLDVSVEGDLTIVEATRRETFTGEVTYTSADTISGVLSTTIRYADYDISIQAPPIVSDISEEVTLVIDFVAVRPGNDDSGAEPSDEVPEPEATEAE